MISTAMFNLTPWAVALILSSLCIVVAGLCVGAYALGCKVTNKKRDVNYVTFCDKKAQERIATTEAQNHLDAREIVRQGRYITDLEVRLKAVDHLAAQIHLATTKGVDITGGVQ